MDVASSSSRRGWKVVRVTRKANPIGWISDDETRERFLYLRKGKFVVPHKFLDLHFFMDEGFLFQKWIASQGLTKFVQMKGECYPGLVEVFYANLKVVNGVIQSRVKGVNITINDYVWSTIVELKAEGLHSHVHDSKSNIWLKNKTIYRDCLRYPGRYKMDKLYLHNCLNKEEKMVTYVLSWLLLPGRALRDRITTEDVFLLNAIKTRIPTNWIEVFKNHMIDVGINHGFNLPYGVFISRVLILQGVDIFEEDRLLCNKSQKIGKASLTHIGLKKTADGWFFRDEQIVVTFLTGHLFLMKILFSFLKQSLKNLLWKPLGQLLKDF
ncbi:hypothetical protein LR48_Vigan08g095600 [Vigna angularis]|uniref:Putative plant transposon protein domain-containing protein n=1 Tax=Phaseolus angularis TaxID=3914 RepID=A0A0L9V622_PHAAN|nr:hypothetical protein LR48_Vigan08g095600 [Vigna angularis]